MQAFASCFLNTLKASGFFPCTQIVTICILVIVALAVPGRGWAEDVDGSQEINKGRFHHEHLVLRVGVFFADYDSSVKLDGDVSSLIGTNLDLERDLGLEDSDEILTGELVLRLTRHQRLEFGYMSLSRSASKVLITTINFGDQTFNVATNVATMLDIDVYRFAYGYSIVNTGATEFGFTVGVHTLDINSSIVDTATATINEQADVTAPLPNVGLFFGREITKSLAVIGKVQIFLLEVDEFDGQLVNATAALEYMPLRRVLGSHLLIGGGYTFFDLDIDGKDSDFTGSINFQVEGPIAYVGLRF